MEVIEKPVLSVWMVCYNCYETQVFKYFGMFVYAFWNSKLILTKMLNCQSHLVIS